jgi:formate-dependent nitrite reductase cytochrome c552 subunit
VTAATVLWLFLLPMLIRGETENPYLGIPAFLMLPGVFVFGLILIPVGIAWRRAQRRHAGLTNGNIPLLTLQSHELHRLFGFVAVTTIANLGIASQWGYSAVNYMDSNAFCGLTCHKVMQPEYTAYLQSSHARVACVECHIGAGASWFVRSKLSGVRQVAAVAFQTYSTPIPSPVQQLRPARETCERCHWPQRMTDDRFVVRTEYASDEQNEPSSTVLLMKVGGHTWRGGVGIHGAHLEANSSITYTATDAHRQVIPQVVYTAADGKTTIYNATDAKVTPEQLSAGEHRTMDCLDCHNRPAHGFQLPERAVDQAMGQGRIDPKLPFIKREAVAALRRDYTDRDTAAREIATHLENFYQTKYPHAHAADGNRIKTAVEAVQAIYLQNVFPDMKVTWASYPNNLGHMDFPGCFRCHDGSHVSADGRMIPNDCSTCHDLLAVEEKNPKILTDLGYNTVKP